MVNNTLHISATDTKRFFATRGVLKFLFFSALVLVSVVATGQTDYSGTYYIAGPNYNSSNTTTNYYLCPTQGWIFYQAVNNFTPTDNGQPFLTTYTCRDGQYDATEAVWEIKKHSSSNYYYIKRKKDNKYLIFNGKVSNAGDNRIRLHIESTSAPDNNALYAIIENNGSLLISPKVAPGYYLNVNGGNKHSFVGEPGKTGGPTGYENTAGIVGIYNSTTDANSKLYLEPLVSAPIITNNGNGTITITAESGTTLYYSFDGEYPIPESSSSATPPVTLSLQAGIEVIKAFAQDADGAVSPLAVFEIQKCKKPVISVSNGTVSISCATMGATIYYTTDGTDPETSTSRTIYSAPFPLGNSTVIMAVATQTGFINSYHAYYGLAITVHSSNEIDNMYGNFLLAEDFESQGSIGSAAEPFCGTIDGQGISLSGLQHALVDYADGAVIKNLFLDNVSIAGGTNTGAFCNVARGESRIYNCGVLATGSSLNADGSLATCSSTIGGSNYVGGIVGLLTGSSRVINCFSYADITGGTEVGGIVGHNSVETNSNNLKTMVMNCIFYGEIRGGTSKAPVYNGHIISNDADNSGVGNFNYFRAESDYVYEGQIDVYNCALAAETRFLRRFEFFRHILNSNRALAAWWATDNIDHKDEMMKWVLEPSQTGTTTPYPILKTPGKYPSIVNIDAENATEGQPRNNGGKLGTLSVTIQMGTQGTAPFGAPSGAALKSGLTTTTIYLNITDKDTAHFNFNYYKVQLPYYNDYGTKNYTDNRVVTGWKIVAITTNTPATGTYSEGDEVVFDGSGEISSTPYNFADRNCTDKDLYSTSHRVFNQGAYWDVPEGVTGITIEPYWGKAAYASDAYPDVVYDVTMSNPHTSKAGGTSARYTNGQNYNINGNSQKVYTEMRNAVDALNTDAANSVYDYAIVLVGNCHSISLSSTNGAKPYTIMSADLDFDNEPDNCYILRFNGRNSLHPVRMDFITVPGLGMAQKTTGGNGSYNFGIMEPLGWFEATNTSLFRVTQFEYDYNKSGVTRAATPYIIQGGVFEQWVSGQSNGVSNNTTYFHVGGNVWFKEFHRGTHQD